MNGRFREKKSRSSKTGQRETKVRWSGLSANAMLPEPREGRFSRALVFAIVVSIMVAVVWASLTPISEVTRGNGVIETSADVEVVENQFGGAVEEIFVEVGEQVLAGQRILVFDVLSLESELRKLRAEKSALDEELARVEHLFSSEYRSHDSELASLVDGSEVFWVEYMYFVAQLETLEFEKEAALESNRNLQDRLRNVNEEIGVLREKKGRYLSHVSSGIFSRSDVEAVEREVYPLERLKLNLDGELEAGHREIRAINLRQTEMITEWRREAALRLSELRQRRVAVVEDLSVIESRIENATIRASVSGSVLSLSVSYPGQVLAPGDTIAEIVQSDGVLKAEIEIHADDLGAIEPGMKARLKVTSYDFTRFGEIEGTVSSVSPTSVLSATQVPVYKVTISLPNDGLNVVLSGRPVRAGMTISAEILSEQKTVLEYLLKPLRVLGDRAFSEA